MSIGFGDINIRVDLITKLKAPGSRANMNRGWREAHAEDDACNQLVIEPVCANSYG